MSFRGHIKLQQIMNENDWMNDDNWLNDNIECQHVYTDGGTSCDLCYQVRIPGMDHIRDFSQNFITRKQPSYEVKSTDFEDLVISPDVLDWAKDFAAIIFSIRVFRSKMRKAIIGACLIYGFFHCKKYADVDLIMSKMKFEMKNLLKAFKIIDVIIAENYPEQKLVLNNFNCTLEALINRLCHKHGLQEFDIGPYKKELRSNMPIKAAVIQIWKAHYGHPPLSLSTI